MAHVDLAISPAPSEKPQACRPKTILGAEGGGYAILTVKKSPWRRLKRFLGFKRGFKL